MGKHMPQSIDLLQGTLDLLILKTLALERMHGWGIAQRIQLVSQEVLTVGQGSLYPALHRLEYKGWIKAEWAASENNRRARFYSLTAAGREAAQGRGRKLGQAHRRHRSGAQQRLIRGHHAPTSNRPLSSPFLRQHSPGCR